jgi:ATP-dependent HslUV protease ATP-binding subunit HslU
VLVPPPRGEFGFGGAATEDNTARQVMRKRLREGQLDDKEIELELAEPRSQLDIVSPPGMEEMAEQLRGMFAQIGQGKRRTRKLPIRDARKLLADEEAARLVNEDDVRSRAVANAEQNGIVFLDEIDKITARGEGHSGADVSRQGVQRDLLPLVEGTTVSTKYGMIKTDHILFIGSGAFHFAKPSDLIPEMQGRFPIRVELDSLSVSDFEQILTSTDACLTTQYAALLDTEGVHLEFRPDGVKRLAEIAWQVNERTENIGARRLYTVMEKLLEDVSFEAGKGGSQTIVIDAGYVDNRLKDLAESEDLARYVL